MSPRPIHIETTERASYWRMPSTLYQATKLGAKPPDDNGAGYVSLQALMQLKGEPWGTWSKRL